MKELALISGAIFGIISIILGAFGAHAFKKILNSERLESFEVGVRYQMYTALALLWIGSTFDFETQREHWAYYGLFWVAILFSGSIYLLSFKDLLSLKLRFLGPITPLGGLLMIIGWFMILLQVLA